MGRLIYSCCRQQAAAFSNTAHRDIRIRPGRRQRPPLATREDDEQLVSEHRDGPSPSQSLPLGERQGKAHSSAQTPTSAVTSTPTPRPATSSSPSPTAQDTSTAGPYKQTLLTSKSIYRSPNGTISARISRPQNQQLAAAETFFGHRTKFLYSAEALRHHAINNHTPEIVVLGASNVGKSSFLNALVGKTGAARVSQKPGRTTLMNAFGVGPGPKIPKELVPKGMAPPRHSLVLVDSPGYGFRSQASWGDAIMKYLEARRMLRGAVLLLSSEKKLLPEDKWMLKTLAEANTRTLVVLTKADKSRGLWTEKCRQLADAAQKELERLDASVGNRWRDSSNAASQIYVTSAGLHGPEKLRNGGGMGGVRAAILEMAGFTLQQQQKVTKNAETVTYTGPIVSFDDIEYKS